MRLLVFSVVALLIAHVSFAQDDQTIYVQVDYMKSIDGMAAEYVAMESEIYKPIHRERAKTGEIVGWQLYKVQYPSGEDVDYDYVTITMFQEFEAIDEDFEDYAAVVKRAHPNRTLDEVNQIAIDTRKLMHTEIIKSLDRFPLVITDPSASLLVDYMKVKPSLQQTYERMELEIWKPMHVARSERDLIQSWGVYQLLFPGGTQYSYSHATVTGFKSWGDIKDSWPDDVWHEVHPNATPDALEERAHETRDLVSTQIWKLIDFVDITALSK